MRRRWQDWMNLLLGLWLIISPLLLAYAGGSGGVPALNSYAVGAALIVLSVLGLLRPAPWLGWVVLLLGLWLVASPFVLDFWGPGLARWNNILTGVLVALAGLSAARVAPGRPTAA
jgi:hypothetical protein